MFSKFKVTSTPNAYSTHFPLVEVYEAEIRRLREENKFLRLQLNEALTELRRQAEKTSFNTSSKGFFQLTKAARNNKKRRIKNLVIESVKRLEEFVPVEVSSFSPYSKFFYDISLQKLS